MPPSGPDAYAAEKKAPVPWRGEEAGGSQALISPCPGPDSVPTWMLHPLQPGVVKSTAWGMLDRRAPSPLPSLWGPDPCSEETVSTGLDPTAYQHRNRTHTPGTRSPQGTGRKKQCGPEPNTWAPPARSPAPQPRPTARLSHPPPCSSVLHLRHVLQPPLGGSPSSASTGCLHSAHTQPHTCAPRPTAAPLLTSLESLPSTPSQGLLLCPSRSQGGGG